MAPDGRWAAATVVLCMCGGLSASLAPTGPDLRRGRYEVFSTDLGRIVRRNALDAPDFKSATALGNITNADLAALDLPESKINQTLEAQNQTLTYDSSPYYDQQAADFARHWIDFPALQASKDVRVYEHPLLSQSYRRADTVTLSFHFPYYGHLVDKVTIATGGFLYLGQYVHSWLAATQYVAPLMAHFDTSSDDAAKIRYVDHGDFFAVEWSRVHLKSRSSTDNDDDESERSPVEQRPFTFQAILHRNGDIAFAYKEIPFEISLIEDNEHPVKVGLSDAYIMDRTIFFVRRKTIYEYHRISLPHAFVGNETAILFKALPTCNQMKTCADCLGDIVHGFQCQWCPSAFSCSDGIDRRRQEWLTLGCDHRNINESRFCDMYPHSPDDADAIVSSTSRTNVPMDGDSSNNKNNEHDKSDKDTSSQESHTETNGNQIHFAVTALLVILVIAVLIFLWLIYAYFFPHSWSGQLLIKYRPTRWHWLRSEPRYTAASIHM